MFLYAAAILPKNQKTMGDFIRKWRMDKGLLIRELAKKIGVTENTVINWEVRGITPCRRHMERIRGFVPGGVWILGA